MSDRSAAFDAFLADTRWSSWARAPLAGDASSRRYLRLTKNGASVIVMDAGPDTPSSTTTFAKIAKWLAAQDLAPPTIHLHDPAQGLMLLEDLGATDIARWVNDHPQDGTTLYRAATDVLIHLDGLTPPDGLTAMTPDVGADMLRITLEWYAGDISGEALIAAMRSHLATLCGPPNTVALRDYHAENLIWRPTETDLHRVGLLDFQDAFLAPRGYDLASLTRDVRRVVVDPATARSATVHFADALGTTPNALSPALACLAVQRNLRILGVFARLAKRDGKRHYIRMIPHLWAMLQDDLAHPALGDLKDVVQTHLPAPAHSAIKDLL